MKEEELFAVFFTLAQLFDFTEAMTEHVLPAQWTWKMKESTLLVE
jgi:hypothetical protein